MVTERPCHSCGAELPKREDGGLLRCAACGAPQVRISQELQAEAAAQRERYDEGVANGASPARPAAEMHWKQVIRFSAGASAAAILLCAFLPPLVVVAWLLPVAVLFLYRMRSPRVVLTPLAGARVGALVGLFCSAGAGVVGTIYLVVRRFGLHRLHGFDTLYAGALAAAQKQTVAQNGPGTAASFSMLGVPEFRAGMLLVFALLAAGVFVLLCVLSGAIAGAMRGARTANRSG